MNKQDLKDFLNAKAEYYEQPEFIETDPIVIPHQFTKKEDIEISAFLVATIAWGNRKSIVKNGFRMNQLLQESPFDFVMNHQETDLKDLLNFKHRTFNGEDFIFFIKSLQNIYKSHGGLQKVFENKNPMPNGIHQFKTLFFSIPHLRRTQKHVSDPLKNSAAKRINMFLRWMVRPADKGVDFGLWQGLEPAQLSCPLDVHSGNVARKLGVLKRKQNDLKAVQELDHALRNLDPIDPVKYDFALFGLGVFEKF